MSSNYTKGNYGLEDVYDKLDRTADAQTSTTDTTTGRGLVVGAFGLGGTTIAPLLTQGEWSDVQTLPTRVFRVISAENPFSNAAAVLNIRYDESVGGRGWQIWGETTGTEGVNEFYGRCTNNNGWQDPQKFYTNRNILGTVSQSGGVPTGAIIQTITNANGTAIRYANGTMICISPLFTVNINDTLGSGFQSSLQAWTFPSAFSTTTGLFTTAEIIGSTGAWGNGSTASATVGNVRGNSFTSRTGDSLQGYAIGRWFTP